MKQLRAVWLGISVVSASLLLVTASPYGRSDVVWLGFPLLLVPPVTVLGWWMQDRETSLQGWPAIVGLLVGFTLTSSLLVGLLDGGDDGGDVTGTNYWMFAPWIAPFVCGPSIVAFYLARWSVRLRTRS